MQGYKLVLVTIAAVSLGYGVVHTWGLSEPDVSRKTDPGAEEYAATPENKGRVKSNAEVRGEGFSSPQPRHPVGSSESPNWPGSVVGIEATSDEPALDLSELLDVSYRRGAGPNLDQTDPIDIGPYIGASDRSAWNPDEVAGDPVEIGDFLDAGGPTR